MKKTILIIASLVATVSMMAQGQVNFGNYKVADGINAPVSDAQTGAKLAGGDYLAMLYWGPAGADPSAFTPVVELSTDAVMAAVPFRTGAAAGLINMKALTIKGVVKDQTFQVQMRAWSAVGGATYEAAYAAATTGGMASTVKLGASNAVTMTGKVLPDAPPAMVGLQAFTVDYIPEPSVLALGLLGGVAFLLRRRS
jgi:hypothetical protein